MLAGERVLAIHRFVDDGVLDPVRGEDGHILRRDLLLAAEALKGGGDGASRVIGLVALDLASGRPLDVGGD